MEEIYSEPSLHPLWHGSFSKPVIKSMGHWNNWSFFSSLPPKRKRKKNMKEPRALNHPLMSWSCGKYKNWHVNFYERLSLEGSAFLLSVLSLYLLLLLLPASSLACSAALINNLAEISEQVFISQLSPVTI